MDAVITLPWPPSVNHYYRHVGPRVLISRDGRRYREQAIRSVRADAFPTFVCQVAVEIDLFPPDRRKRDLDNSLKSLLDALTHAGVWEDDSQIVRLHVTKHPPEPPGGRVTVRIADHDPIASDP